MKIILIIVLSFFKFTAMAQLEFVDSGVYKWMDHPIKKGELRESRAILEGQSTYLDYFEIHATTQFPGAKPSTAHANDDKEECIIVKEGLMKATIEGKSAVLGAGGVILLMPRQMHSLQNIGDTNLTYYVMGYKAKNKMDLERGEASGGSLMINADSLVFNPSSTGGRTDYFDRSTAMFEHFAMHKTVLSKKGPFIGFHKHIETEILLMISGESEITIDGKDYKATAGDFYLINSTINRISNSTDKPCSYLAFKWK